MVAGVGYDPTNDWLMRPVPYHLAIPQYIQDPLTITTKQRHFRQKIAVRVFNGRWGQI